MVLPVRVFVDSSVLIEFIKGNQQAGKMLNRLNEAGAETFINDIVFSEFMFHYLSLKSGKSPLTMKGKKEIGNYVGEKDPLEFLDQFEILHVNAEIVHRAYNLMREQNLLPNDAIILATCAFHEIDLLATLDLDFESACRNEGLRVAIRAEDI